jgi:hypothetical protein
MAFADAVGAAEEHEASEGGALGEVLVGLLDLRVVFLIGFGMVSSKRDGGGSPLVGVACEGGVCWHGFVGWCCWLATLVVAVIAELAVEVEVDEVGRSDAMALMIDFGVSGLIKGVVTEFDAMASEGETDFVEAVVEANGAVLADGALDSGLEEFFKGFGLKFKLSEVFGAFLEPRLGALAGAAVEACVIVCLDPVGELGVEGF